LNNPDQKYATNASGPWATEIVGSPGYWDCLSSIAVDSLDKVHISYDSNDGIKYVSNAFGPPGLCSATAEAYAYGASPVYGAAGLGRLLACFLLPIGAVIALKFWRRETIL
jgi:hypothetical protein